MRSAAKPFAASMKARIVAHVTRVMRTGNPIVDLKRISVIHKTKQVEWCNRVLELALGFGITRLGTSTEDSLNTIAQATLGLLAFLKSQVTGGKRR
eukprot:70048-Amphidinium_carterae.2